MFRKFKEKFFKKPTVVSEAEKDFIPCCAVLEEIFERLEPDDQDLIPGVSQAKKLPNRWLWKDYMDGSGHLESPDGKSYFTYDLETREYDEYSNGDWDFWIHYPEPMNLTDFKEFAESIICEGLRIRDLKGCNVRGDLDAVCISKGICRSE